MKAVRSGGRSVDILEPETCHEDDADTARSYTSGLGDEGSPADVADRNALLGSIDSCDER